MIYISFFLGSPKNLPRFKVTLGKPFQEELIRGLLFRVDHLDALQKIFPLF